MGKRARLGAVLAPLAFALILVSPLPLEAPAHRLAAIAAAVVVAWVTEVVPIPVTALMIAPAMVALGICEPKAAFAPYADPLLFLFYGAFFISHAMQRHGLDRRVAHAIVGSRLVTGVAWRTRLALMVTGMLLSMWISNTASAAIVVPILLGTLARGASSRDRAASSSLLAVAYAASIGGVGTLVGTPPNLITVRFLKDAGREIGFVQWSAVGLPAAAMIVTVIYFVTARRAARVTRGPSPVAGESRGPMSRGERVTAMAFALAVVGWLVPGLWSATGDPLGARIAELLPPPGVAMLAAAPLFLLRAQRGGEAVLPWSEARKIDWGIIMLFGGGISLGTQMFDTGLAAALGRGFVELTGVRDVWTLTFVAIAFTILFTEVCSNTAAANMLVPLVIGVSTELGVSPVPPALGVGLAASCAFMMPIATGPNAIVYATGRVGLMDMVRVGFVLNLLCAALLFGLLRVLCPLMGFM
jgi:solute carrier family 13 (sodium-dependent dicarboxylate transporter), member 2/3/5